MQFSRALQAKRVIDIISIADTHYAVTTDAKSVPGCVTVPVGELSRRLGEFIGRGYSQRHGKPYHAVAGVTAWCLLSYGLTQLSPARKQTFSHALMGLGSRTGALARWGGQKLGRSAFLVPIAAQDDAIAFLERWGAAWTAEVVFRG